MIVENSAARSISFTVNGEPLTKGSAKGFVPWAWVETAWALFKRTGKKTPPRVVITNDSPDTKAWQEQITEAAREARRGGPLVRGELMAGPVVVDVVFYLPRPLKLPNVTVAHTTRPDFDKLLRPVLDALTGVIYADDGQAVAGRIAKQYAPIGGRPGVAVTITEATVADPAAPPLFT